MQTHFSLSKTFLSLAIVLFSAFLPLTTHAITETTIGSAFNAAIEPANPGPRETATISLTSFGINLSNSTITWTVNGSQVKKGVGEVKLPVTLGALGSKTTVRISVSTPTGEESSQKTLVFIPQELTIAWEADSYVPPLYKGKALPGPGASVRLVALPNFRGENGAAIAPSNLTYRWKQGGADIMGGNGKGIQTIRTKINVLGKTRVSVEVSSADGALRATKMLDIEPATPRITFYEDHPLLGTKYFSPIRGAHFLTGTESAVRGEPFFFSLPREGILFSWFVGGKKTEGDADNSQIITLRHETDTRGSAQIQALVTHKDFLFQEGKSSFTASFGQ